MTVAENIRELALDVLLELEKEKEYSNRLVRSVLDKYDYLEGRDKSFFKRLTEGTIERQIELDYYLDSFSAVPVKKMKPLIRCLLRMSVYQLLYMDSVPDSAVCNEACKLAVRRHFQNLRGFVNGVLRTISRNRESLPLPDAQREPVRYFSVKYSMPEWLVELWLEEYGREITDTLLEGLLKIHPVSLRFRTSLTEQERENVLAELRAGGARVEQGAYLPYCFLLEHTENVAGLPGFAEGKYTVQDVSSALAVEAAGIREGDFVLDVCAAPGGKSLLAAEKAGKTGRVLARDVSEEKAALIRENAGRLGADNLEVQVYDARVKDESLSGRADVVLLDVPCSGLGVIGKKRDIKYRITREGLDSLSELQRQIVRASSDYVKPGGTLLYSTCTIHRRENEDMVRFIAEELHLQPQPLTGILPEKLLWQKEQQEGQKAESGEARQEGLKGKSGEARQERQKAENGEARQEGLKAESGNVPADNAGLTQEERDACIQLLPGYMEADGFFIARFCRPLNQ